jgi:SpoVK/Ycf46/Vps4 family AAA+-type ATPase
LLGPLATLSGALPVIRLQAGPGETVRLDRLPGYNGTVGVTMGRTGGIDGEALNSALTLHLPPPDRKQRARFWQASGLPLAPAEGRLVQERYLLTGGRIMRVAAAAQNAMRLAGRERATADDVRRAMRAANRQALETLATPLEAVPGWSTLVVPERVQAELAVLEARCRHRERLLAHVGPAFAHTLNRGVRALFSGPSGTGKTLAARTLAGVLQMDLYRVDLASVVNKYIGETEKNLNQLFTYAEELDIILLLDEGDSLMTQRTDVRGANDRYANLETNFLLQRLESYEGIILVTTNAAQRIDDAFVRRLDVVVDFTLPDAAERRRLWQLHLPPEHAVEPAYLDRVVERCKLSGGQIRNSALHASLLALRQERPADAPALDAALQREYRKAGLPYPLAPLA